MMFVVFDKTICLASEAAVGDAVWAILFGSVCAFCLDNFACLLFGQFCCLLGSVCNICLGNFAEFVLVWIALIAFLVWIACLHFLFLLFVNQEE